MKKKTLPALLLALSLLLAGCGESAGPASSLSGSSGGGESSLATGMSLTPLSAQYTEEDTDESWNESGCVKITFSGSSIETEGSSVSVNGSTATITAAGTYLLSGESGNARLIIDAGKNDTVRLILNGLKLTSAESAPLFASQSEKVILTLADGSENILTDNRVSAGEEDPGAALFCQDSLSINGTGSLTVAGNWNNGIETKDDLIIANGALSVTAANDALRGRDSVTILDGIFHLEADGDGLKSNNDTDTGKGWILLEGGTYTIVSGEDGIQAETLLQVDGGTYAVTSGGGSANAEKKQGNTPAMGGLFQGGGRQGRQRPGTESGSGSSTAAFTPTAADTSSAADSSGTETDNSVSRKGIKGGTGILVRGGTLTIDSSDDSVHANGDVWITGGEFSLSTGDDGFHADGELLIDDGSILISTCYEGLEGANVTMNGGDIRLAASDDGVNAAGGSDGETDGPMGPDSFRSGDGHTIRITGGLLQVSASGDGLDSNGSLYISGGTVLINGPESGGDGALDYDGSCEITGGILIAAGSSAMAQAPDSNSTQLSLMVTYSSAQAAGTLFSLRDAEGTVIAAFAPEKDYQSIVVSTPSLQQGTTYTLASGGACGGESAEGLYTGGSLSGQTDLCGVTLASAVTSVSDDGSAVQAGGFGGGMGGRPGGNRGELPSGMEEPPEGFPDGDALPGGDGSRPEPPADGEFPGFGGGAPGSAAESTP